MAQSFFVKASSSPTEAGQISHAKMRDGLVLFGIAHLGLAVSLVPGAILYWDLHPSISGDMREFAFVLSGISGALWLVLSSLAGWKVWQARRTGLHTWTSALLIAICFLLFVALVTVASILAIPSMEPMNRWPLVAAPPAVVLALGLGYWGAGLRQKGNVSLRRRILFCVPMIVALLALVIPVAGLAGLVRQWNGSEYDRSLALRWPGQLPAILRMPATEILLLTERRDVRWALHALGLVSMRRMRTTALSGGQDELDVNAAWTHWAKCAPEEALQAALAVPQTSTPWNPASPYDNEAGCIIGERGSPGQITERLTGSFSSRHELGLLLGLSPQNADACFDILRQRFETLQDRASCMAMAKAPAKFMASMRGYLEENSEPQLRLMSRAFELTAGQHPDLWEWISVRGLNSPGVQARLFVLNRWKVLPKPVLDALLKSAEGGWADSTPVERRLAGWHIRSQLKLQTGEQPTAVGELSATERAALDELSRRARHEWNLDEK